MKLTSDTAAIGLALLGLAIAGGRPLHADEACSIVLAVRPVAQQIHLPDAPALEGSHFLVELTNTGEEPVLLVEPGDGSAVGWRTPVVTWTVWRDDELLERPEYARCGNINPLRPDEIFSLAPGESRIIGDWLPSIGIDRAGRYTLTLRYENDPDLVWQGVPLGPHDASAMRGVRQSSRCTVVSDRITVDVTLGACECGGRTCTGVNDVWSCDSE